MNKKLGKQYIKISISKKKRKIYLKIFNVNKERF